MAFRSLTLWAAIQASIANVSLATLANVVVSGGAELAVRTIVAVHVVVALLSIVGIASRGDASELGYNRSGGIVDL